jgi:ketosteroid isomerase-like protein
MLTKPPLAMGRGGRGFAAVLMAQPARRYVDGDTVITEVRSTATQSGPLTLATGERVEATGRTLRERGVYIDRVVDGKIVEETAYYDRHTVLEQLGQLPTG